MDQYYIYTYILYYIINIKLAEETQVFRLFWRLIAAGFFSTELRPRPFRLRWKNWSTNWKNLWWLCDKKLVDLRCGCEFFLNMV